jgi:hypothetical protein
MKLSNLLLGLFLALSVGFLASALLYTPPEAKGPSDIQTFCAEKMKDRPNILCVGKWILDVNGNCSFVCSGADDVNNAPPIGGDSDAHGCKASAGYSWCESKGKCLRLWEEDCMCAGIAGFACPIGYGCNMSASYPDASGTCVPDN